MPKPYRYNLPKEMPKAETVKVSVREWCDSCRVAEARVVVYVNETGILFLCLYHFRKHAAHIIAQSYVFKHLEAKL